jgi:hypothetical protein
MAIASLPLLRLGWGATAVVCCGADRGSILNLINQGDALFGEGHLNLIKIVLTYAVPYCVATYGAVSYRMSRTSMSLRSTA